MTGLKPKLILLAVVIAFATAVAADSPKQALVTLWITTGDGRQPDLGAGVFTSPDGQVLTCYHVIEGARRIEVFNQQINQSSDVVIEAVAPQYDLALLRVRNLKEKVRHLTLIYDPPLLVLQERLSILGHPAGLTDQDLWAHITKRPYTLSQEFRDPDTHQRIMAVDNVRLFSLQTVGFRGLSGGALLSSKGVVGIVSGSLTTGGTIAWAIPVGYARQEHMDVVGRRPEDISDWNALSTKPFLLGDINKALRLRIPLSPSLATAMQRYFVAVDQLNETQQKIPAFAFQAKQDVVMLKKFVDVLPPSRQKQKIRKQNNIAIAALAEQFGATAKAVSDFQREWVARLFAIVAAGAAVEEDVTAFFAQLPDEPSTHRLRAEFDQALEKISKETLAIAAQQQVKAPNEAELFSKIVDMENWTPLDLRSFAEQIEDLLDLMSDPQMVVTFEALVRGMRDLGKVVQRLSTHTLS
jgi:hypothetical protein